MTGGNPRPAAAPVAKKKCKKKKGEKAAAAKKCKKKKKLYTAPRRIRRHARESLLYRIGTCRTMTSW